MDVLTIFLFFMGLFFGSFLLVVVDRLPKHQSPLTGRSHCDHCNHKLAWFDLIPVFSFIFTRGTCRYCHTALSPYYPIVEFITGILFAVMPLVVLTHTPAEQVSYYLQLGFWLYTIATLIIIFFTDLKYGLIPFIVVIPASILTAVYVLITTPQLFLNHLFSAIGAMGLFLVLFLITRGRGMGFGDVVLVFYLGILLGFPGIGISLYMAFLTGAAVSLILILTGKKKLKGGTIPFGPFLVVAAVISLIWSRELEQLFSAVFIR